MPNGYELFLMIRVSLMASYIEIFLSPFRKLVLSTQRAFVVCIMNHNAGLVNDMRL